ncbi:MAG TPA: carbon-nitrogen hydrolase family protein [Pseudolabrys sp.]|nr:carbon-nitrogen hydrolase family protein [Pseudolabrys sp.]
MSEYPKFKACAAHVAPVFLDANATVQKACSLIAEAAGAGARLIAFPESFIPGFPVWASVQAPIKNHEFFKRLAANSIEIPGPEVTALSHAAREHAITVSIGVSERSPVSVGCLWNSNLLIAEDGTLLNHHRKLVPTFYEKLIWSNGDGHGLRVSDTSIGKIGMLICGENTNPLARFSLMAQGEQVHISSYPPVWPTRQSNEPGRYDLASAIRIRAGAHSFEGKVFNVVSSGFLDSKTLEALRGIDRESRETLEQSPQAVSMVLGPSGEVISDTLCDSEGLLYQDIDVEHCVEPKQFHDVVGYYNRFDVFDLKVTRKRLAPIEFIANVPEQADTPDPEQRTSDQR